jgi:hypothetical protein
MAYLYGCAVIPVKTGIQKDVGAIHELPLPAGDKNAE